MKPSLSYCGWSEREREWCVGTALVTTNRVETCLRSLEGQQIALRSRAICSLVRCEDSYYIGTHRAQNIKPFLLRRLGYVFAWHENESEVRSSTISNYGRVVSSKQAFSPTIFRGMNAWTLASANSSESGISPRPQRFVLSVFEYE